MQEFGSLISQLAGIREPIVNCLELNVNYAKIYG